MLLVSRREGTCESAPCASSSANANQESSSSSNRGTLRVPECRYMVSKMSKIGRKIKIHGTLKSYQVHNYKKMSSQHKKLITRMSTAHSPAKIINESEDIHLKQLCLTRCHQSVYLNTKRNHLSCLKLALIMIYICFYLFALLTTHLCFGQFISSSSSNSESGSSSSSGSGGANLMSGGDDEELSKTMEGTASDGELSLNSAPNINSKQVDSPPSVEDHLPQHSTSIWLPDEQQPSLEASIDSGLSSSSSESNVGDIIRRREQQQLSSSGLANGSDEEFGGKGEFSRQYISVLNNQSNIVLSPMNGSNYSTSFILTGGGVGGQSNDNNINANSSNNNNSSGAKGADDVNSIDASGPSQVISSRKASGYSEEPGTRISESIAIHLSNRTYSAALPSNVMNNIANSSSIRVHLHQPTVDNQKQQQQQQQQQQKKKKKKKKYRLNRVEVFAKRLHQPAGTLLTKSPNNNELLPAKERMISYSMVPTTTGRPRKAFSVVVGGSKTGEDADASEATSTSTAEEDDDDEDSSIGSDDQMVFAATSSPNIRGLALIQQSQQSRKKQKQQASLKHHRHQLIRQRSKDSLSNVNSNTAAAATLILPAAGNQFKLAPASLSPAGSSYLADQLVSIVSSSGSGSSNGNNNAVNNNNNKESLFFDATLLPTTISLPHLFPSSVTGGVGSVGSQSSSSLESPPQQLLSAPQTRLPNGSNGNDDDDNGDSLPPSSSTSSSTSYGTSLALTKPQRDLSSAANVRDKQTRSPSIGSQQQQQLAKVSEFLITSSSHPASEFETTLKQQPDQQHEPIVNQDTSAEAQVSGSTGDHSPAASSSGSTTTTTAATSSSPFTSQASPNSSLDADLTGEDESDASDGDGSPQDSSLEATPNVGSSDFPFKTGAHLKEQQQQQQRHNNNNNNNRSKPTRLDAHNSVKVDAKEQQQQQPMITDTELLVGPFKSEAEAPATITLSGVVYQKSGASSSLVHSKALKSDSSLPTTDNLSVSGSSSNKVSASDQQQQQLKAVKLLPDELTVGSIDKYWPYTSIYTSSPQQTASSSAPSPQLGSINEILLGSSMKANQAAEVADSALQFTDSYLGMSGGIRLSPFPFSPSSLFPSNPSILHHQVNDLTNQLVTNTKNSNSNNHHHSKDAPSAHSMISSVLDFANLTPVSSSTHDPQQQHSLWTNSAGNKLTTTKDPSSYFAQTAASNAIRAQTAAAASDSHHYSSHSGKHKEKGPIVIVQKDVKPVKYHLMRAYLKLRRLLRPFEATYVFLNDRHGTGLGGRFHHHQQQQRRVTAAAAAAAVAANSLGRKATESSLSSQLQSNHRGG